MASRMLRLIPFFVSLLPLALCQQTFQNTIFDLPSQLGGEPVGVAAQAQGAPLFVQQPDVKPPSAPGAGQAPAAAQPLPQAQTPPPAFTFPTLAPFTLPSHPTVAPFTFPSHPTIAPFTFPTHQPLVFTTPSPIVPPSPYAFVPQPAQPGLQAGFQQPTGYQQYSGYPQQQQQYYGQQQQQYYNNYYNNNYNQYQPQQISQQQQYQQQQIPQQPVPQQVQAQSFEPQSQVVQPQPQPQQTRQVAPAPAPVPTQDAAPHVSTNPQAIVVQPVLRQQPQQPTVNTPIVNAVATHQVVDTDSNSRKANELNKEFQPKPAHVEKAALDAEVDSNIDRHIWFNADYNVNECRKNLRGMGVKFQKKFPSYLQKGGKDRELSELVEQRLLECERKSTASHWDKVDTLLQKINLTKSEEGECRAGLIQERISCVNLLKYACQFVDSSYHFKLVPARITIQEARQAESGAEKCRQVVRIVKQRLESGAVTL